MISSLENRWRASLKKKPREMEGHVIYEEKVLEVWCMRNAQAATGTREGRRKETGQKLLRSITLCNESAPLPGKRPNSMLKF